MAEEEADWEAQLPSLSKALPTLSTLDHHLRCRICKDFLVAPLITTCGHTFCSLCIRRALATEAHCPACRSREEEFKLRKNVLAEDLVEAFAPLRRGLMELHRKSEQQSVVHEVTSSSQKSEAGTNDDAPRRRSKRRRLSRSSSDKDSPERDTQPLERGEVLCPICSKPVQEESINSHVDRCLAGEPEDDATRSKHFRSVAKPATARAPEKRLPKLNYSVLTEAKLRTELSRLNIPTQGSKATLQRRHTEWVTLWNSNLDAKNPSARRVLLRELKAWEDAQTRPNVKLTTEEVEERAADDGVAFKELIERARASALAAKRKSIEAAAEDAAAEATHPPSVKPVLDV